MGAREGLDGMALDGYVPLRVAGVSINPVCVPHDSREPTQVTLRHGDTKIGVLSDLGSVTQHVVSQFTSELIPQ